MFVQTVAKGDQTISFSPIADQVYGASPIPLSAISSVNLPVSYSVVSGPAYVSANHLYITGAGAVEVQADQAGNATYNAAPSVDQTINVAPAPLTVAVDSQGIMYSSSLYSFIAQYVGFVNGDNASVITTPPTFSLGSPVMGPGKYVINASGAVAPNYQITYVPGTLYVSEAASQVAISSSVPSSIVYGQDVLLSATVTGDTGMANPTGYVTFYDYGTPTGHRDDLRRIRQPRRQRLEPWQPRPDGRLRR